ncbi:MAG: hypothetical protein KA105_06510 [Caulobacter sp.]|nr:hypothetical protein [Caulobacter sp.]
MAQSNFEAEARLIVSRNLTTNVAGAAASFDAFAGHLDVTYFLFGPSTDDDEELRELSVGELIAAFPAIKTASSGFEPLSEMEKAGSHLILARDQTSD